MKKSILPLGFAALIAALFSSCTTPYSPNAKAGSVTGAALGAVAGAVVGHQSGRGLEGAAIGGAVGALAGGTLGSAQDDVAYAHQLPPAQPTATYPSYYRAPSISHVGYPAHYYGDPFYPSTSLRLGVHSHHYHSRYGGYRHHPGYCR